MRAAGISLIELLIVISLVALLAAVAAPLSANMLISSQHSTAVDRLIGSLKKAQRYSMIQKNNVEWGVCLVNSRVIRLYEESCIGAGQREEYILPNSVSVIGLSDISFSTVRGMPNSAVSITIDSGTVTTVEITAAGGIGVAQ